MALEIGNRVSPLSVEKYLNLYSNVALKLCYGSFGCLLGSEERRSTTVDS